VTRAVGRHPRNSHGQHLSGSANLLICPNLDAANILFNVLKITTGHGVTVGPILLGAAATAHILTPRPRCAAWST
jgi:phosphotransacetylase